MAYNQYPPRPNPQPNPNQNRPVYGNPQPPRYPNQEYQQRPPMPQQPYYNQQTRPQYPPQQSYQYQQPYNYQAYSYQQTYTYQQPAAPLIQPEPVYKKGAAIAAMIFGILSLFGLNVLSCFIFVLVSCICVGVSKKQNGKLIGMAIAGYVCSIIEMAFLGFSITYNIVTLSNAGYEIGEILSIIFFGIMI